MKFSIISIFPEMISGYTEESILGRAQADGVIDISVYDPRDFADNKHKSIDEPPYGGGPGMVMQAEPILKAVDAARRDHSNAEERVLVTSARGTQFDAAGAQDIVETYQHVIIICGRYEGIDYRVIEALNAEEVSVGSYILTGGELPALIMTDVMARFVDGVLGNEASLEDERAAGSHTYTRPETFTYQDKEYRVPSILLSGHHEKIRQWRQEQADESNPDA